ncbi:tRNA (guanine(26)-N(2))-dimethyltransferase, partial [Eudyptes moseleyi]
RPPSCAVMTEFARLQLQPKGIRGRVGLPRPLHPQSGSLPQQPPEPPVGIALSLQGGLRVLEALAASGLRSIRFAKEVPGLR